MPSGMEALKYLSEAAQQADPGSSSHWDKYHSSFGFKEGRFEGLVGFGQSRSRRSLPFRLLEQLFQKKFRKMSGVGFESLDKLAADITKKQNLTYSLDVLRQALTLSFIREHVPDVFSQDSIGCVIGDGFASMTSLLIASRSAGHVVLVNLTKTLLVDLWYLKIWLGDERFNESVDLVTNAEELAESLKKPVTGFTGLGRVIAIQAKDHELLSQCPLTFALNIVSMQEMDPHIISAYFDDLRASNSSEPVLFYCCNREEKYLPDGTVTRFSDYPWSSEDMILIDELCPWHQQYYTSKPPFFRPYDGPIRHRLAWLEKS